MYGRVSYMGHSLDEWEKMCGHQFSAGELYMFAKAGSDFGKMFREKTYNMNNGEEKGKTQEVFGSVRIPRT